MRPQRVLENVESIIQFFRVAGETLWSGFTTLHFLVAEEDSQRRFCYRACLSDGGPLLVRSFVAYFTGLDESVKLPSTLCDGDEAV